MANPFLNKTDLMDRDVETAIMLEQAITHDIGNAVAYTDGKQVYVNTDDNLFNILPAYDHRFLKWLLWHERYHMELRHHNRFFKYLKELDEEKTIDEFHVTKDEVNIIMDILVHDSLCKMFPELIDTALANLAQMRNRNSLEYTFKTFTLEEMLDEYKAHKKGEDGDKEGEDGEETKEGKGKKGGDESGKSKDKEETKEDKPKKSKDKSEKAEEKGHGSGGKSDGDSKAEDGEPEIKEDSERPEPLPDEHSKTDWSKLEGIDTKEFITDRESNEIKSAIAELKRKKFRLAKLTETLNGLVTSTRQRTYAKPSPIKLAGGAVLKGSTPGRTKLYLIFDASGSMGAEMETFKEIISKSVPQAMQTPCEWFAGCNEKIPPYKRDRGDGYFKGKFNDFMSVYAQSGYDDDGDRTIELCWQAEQLGYSPIGVTDGGGQISWSADKLKQLKRTVLVGQNNYWLSNAKKINPTIQTLYV